MRAFSVYLFDVKQAEHADRGVDGVSVTEWRLCDFIVFWIFHMRAIHHTYGEDVEVDSKLYSI